MQRTLVNPDVDSIKALVAAAGTVGFGVRLKAFGTWVTFDYDTEYGDTVYCGSGVEVYVNGDRFVGIVDGEEMTVSPEEDHTGAYGRLRVEITEQVS